jgi:TRAP-type C4-dicarboxylate transport system permease small subunit
MRELIDRAIKWVEVLVLAMAGFGAFLIFVQMVWISYGVFMRYAMGSPDRLVTEATALLLFPVAMVGLAYAMREDSYPRVTLLTNALRPNMQKALALFNTAIMALIGLFFSMTAIIATIRAFESGAASEILRWPRYLFWTPVALSLSIFTLYAVLRLLQIALRPAKSPEARDGMV